MTILNEKMIVGSGSQKPPQLFSNAVGGTWSRDLSILMDAKREMGGPTPPPSARDFRKENPYLIGNFEEVWGAGGSALSCKFQNAMSSRDLVGCPA